MPKVTLKVSWINHSSNVEQYGELPKLTSKVLQRTLILSINQKENIEILNNIMRKEDLENLALTGHIEIKGDRRKQRVTYLRKWMAGQVLGEIKKRQNI